MNAADDFDDIFGEGPSADCYSHVLRYYGFDLAAGGVWVHDFAACPFCFPLPPSEEPALILTDEVLHWGRRIHFVCCGNCGTRGPWANTESSALALWNAATELCALRSTRQTGGQMIGTQPVGAIDGVVISAVSHEGLRVTINGRPGRLAIVDDAGQVVAAGADVAKEAEAVAVNSYRGLLIGRGHLRVLSKPLESDLPPT